jgi:hypothetical protein
MKIVINGVVLTDDLQIALHEGRPVQKRIIGGTTTTTTAGTTTTTTAGTTITTTTTQGIQGSGNVVIKVKFNSVPTSASSSFMKLKYGKSAMVHFEEDDAPADFPQLLNYFRGTGPAVDGITYPGKRFSDGCGNDVLWTLVAACNVRSNFDNAEVMDPVQAPFRGNFPYTYFPTMLANDCFPAPHGYYHGDQGTVPTDGFGNPDWYVRSGFNRSLNVSECVKWIWQKTNGFLANYMVIPQDSGGYNVELKAQGLLAQSSEGTTDGEAQFPHPPELFTVNGNSFVSDVIDQYANPAKIHYAAFRRFFFVNYDDPSAISTANAQYDYIVANGTPDNPQFRRYATHGYTSKWSILKGFLDHMDAGANDKVWFTTLNEFLDYVTAMRMIVKNETLSGDTLTINLNYNNVPVETLFRDLTLKVSADASIQSITVQNAQRSTSNIATGLINVFNRRKVTAYPYTQQTVNGGGLVTGILPLRTTDLWMDNSQQIRLDALVDHDKTKNLIVANAKENLIYPNYDVNIDVDYLKCTVQNLAISFDTGAGGTTQTHIILVKTDDTQVDIGTWTQNGFRQTDNFPFNQIYRIKRIILRALTNLQYGSEIEITATYQPPLPNPYIKPKPLLGQPIGVNLHPWDLSTNQPHSIWEEKMAAFLSLNMYNGSIRLYDDAYAVKDLQGRWKIGTEIRGFTTDLAFARIKSVMPAMRKRRCVQNQSLIVQQTWNISYADKVLQGNVFSYVDHGSWGELRITVTGIVGSGYATKWHIYSNNVKVGEGSFGYVIDPSIVGDQLYFTTSSFPYSGAIEMRKSQESHIDVPWPADGNLVKNNFALYDTAGYTAFVYASRLGRNPNVPDYPVVPGDTENPMTKGSDLVEDYEFGNEWNAWWTNWNGFWSGQDFFYPWSMCFDGHMGTYANRGVLQADPTARLTITGLANERLDPIKSVIEISRRQRGYNPDGTINVPFHEINIHCYSSAGGQYSGSQGGLPPEQGMRRSVREYVGLIQDMLPQVKLRYSEWGWDENPNSPLGVRPYAPYTAPRELNAIWHIRTLIMFAVEGVDGSEIFRLYQDGDDSNAGQFGTMAVLTQTGPNSFARNMIGDYIRQYTEFGNYVFDKELGTSLPEVYCYQMKNGNSIAIFLFSVEITDITGGAPSFTERTGNFSVPVPSGANLAIRTFRNDGSNTMATQNVTASGNTFSVAYGAKPKIIQIL